MGSARPMPPNARDAIVTQRRVDQSGRHEHGGLRGGVRDRLQHAAASRRRRSGAAPDAGSKASGNIRNR